MCCVRIKRLPVTEVIRLVQLLRDKLNVLCQNLTFTCN